MVIGITGGVGAGKSRVLRILEERYGARIILADEVAADLERPGEPGLAGLVDVFGSEILTAEGELDRAAFAARIFRDEEARRRVNAIIHPLAWAAIARMVRPDPGGISVVESALFDERSREICDVLVYVRTSEENRIRRLMENRGYSRQRCLDIIRRQQDESAFLRLSDYVLGNDGTFEQMEMQIERMLRLLLADGVPAKEKLPAETVRERGKESVARAAERQEL